MLALAASAFAVDPTPAAAPASTIPDDRNYRSKVDFQTSWEDYLTTRKGQPCDVIFIGDSITQNFAEAVTPRWPLVGKPVWDKYYGSRNALDFGVGSDSTQHTIWRLKNLDVKSFKPQAAVLLIGTNNFKDTAEEIAAGVKAVIATTQETFPGVKIILCSILPNARATELMAAANALLQPLADDRTVIFLDLAASFPREGENWKGLSRDKLHLTTAGYETWAGELQPLLQKLAPGSVPTR